MTPTTRGSNPDTSDAIKAAATSAPGAFAGVLLAPGPAERLVIDVLVQEGQDADAATLNLVKSLLAEQSGKPVTVRGPNTLNAAASSYSSNDIRGLAAQGLPQSDGTAVIHLLFLSGDFEKDGVLGVTVRGDTMAVFPDAISRSASPLVSPSRIERSVVVHELGHVLGLVDLFLDANREDPDHPGHSKNRNSVMFWAVESDLVAQLFTGPPPVDFDSADLADLRRIRGGAAKA